MSDPPKVNPYVICHHCLKETLGVYFKGQHYPLCPDGFREWVEGGDLLQDGVKANVRDI